MVPQYKYEVMQLKVDHKANYGRTLGEIEKYKSS